MDASKPPAPAETQPSVSDTDPALLRPDLALVAGSADSWALSGHWTLAGLGLRLPTQALPEASGPARVLDATALRALDSAGAWVLRAWLGSAKPALQGWQPQALALMKEVLAREEAKLASPPPGSRLQRVGKAAVAMGRQAQAFLHFAGELSHAACRALPHRRLWRLRAIGHEVEIGGYDALPIIGLTSFLLGVVVAYQGADQLRHYGASVFVVELVGYAMLREFAPLISAIIIAGRSGSAYAAQIGSMVVAEEVDALRTLGIDPLQRLVLPKILALSLALPLLTVFADITGVFGGMVMARWRLDIGYGEFAERFSRVMQGSALLLGLGKSLVFALIIAAIGCFQGLRTQGSADSVGRQTTLAVVQAIFLVIVADSLFSVVFNMLEL